MSAFPSLSKSATAALPQFCQSFPISANVEFIKKITPSEQLKRKTNICVLNVASKKIYIYRDSSRKQGWLSREIYIIENGEIKFQDKDSMKYEPKKIPTDAYLYEHDSIKIYSVKKIEEEQLVNIKNFLDSLDNK